MSPGRQRELAERLQVLRDQLCDIAEECERDGPADAIVYLDKAVRALVKAGRS